MFSPVCQKCNLSATVIPASQKQLLAERLLKQIAGYQQLHCNNCGARWNQMEALNIFGLLERVIFLILAGEVCYLLWSYIPH